MRLTTLGKPRLGRHGNPSVVSRQEKMSPIIFVFVFCIIYRRLELYTETAFRWAGRVTPSGWKSCYRNATNGCCGCYGWRQRMGAKRKIVKKKKKKRIFFDGCRGAIVVADGADRSVQSSHGRPICSGLPARARGYMLREEQQAQSGGEEWGNKRSWRSLLWTGTIPVYNGHFGRHCGDDGLHGWD